ncbi:hypothetical protein COEREDRAFT_82946 [Coemansia reversa NRRL 1564]|uniref:Uncharacterized protein n=1 Tax=Coemansia reversa (strain ATCC 12441 / NRRL 1564) TaxID=763665 RepID=A0A2G5B546_COERN|nr:hypothetical protein COEREDRAFT_82946 [Coemansia reversa NRRL 1564]|eukprot:PIA14121.1 hypothetical protein COEREDRAFT_82946 [Coemansia reversa NRRL 1564]
MSNVKFIMQHYKDESSSCSKSYMWVAVYCMEINVMVSCQLEKLKYLEKTYKKLNESAF